MGGSQGAHAINRIMVQYLRSLDSLPFDCFFQTGEKDYSWVQASLKDRFPGLVVKRFFNDLPTIYEKTLRLKIPPGTQNNAKFRLKGYGMPHMNGNETGDAYVQVNIAVPKKLNRKQKALAKELAEAGF